MIKVPFDLFRAVALARAKRDVRAYLQGVLIETTASGERGYIIATDGHRLHYAAFTLDTPVGGVSVQIRPTDVDMLLGVPKRIESFDIAGGVLPVQGATSRPIIIRADDGTMRSTTTDDAGSYPDWRRVVPPTSPKSAVPADGKSEWGVTALLGVNAVYLADVAKAAGLLGKGTIHARILIREHVRGSYSIALDGRPDFGVVISGLRKDRMEVSSITVPDVPR